MSQSWKKENNDTTTMFRITDLSYRSDKCSVNMFLSVPCGIWDWQSARKQGGAAEITQCVNFFSPFKVILLKENLTSALKTAGKIFLLLPPSTWYFWYFCLTPPPYMFFMHMLLISTTPILLGQCIKAYSINFLCISVILIDIYLSS
jgi:hypothetical protein